MATTAAANTGEGSSSGPPLTPERLRNLYPSVDESEAPLPRSWSPKDKYNYIGLSQNNLRVHYKGTSLFWRVCVAKNRPFNGLCFGCQSIFCERITWNFVGSLNSVLLVSSHDYKHLEIDYFETEKLTNCVVDWVAFLDQSSRIFFRQVTECWHLTITHRPTHNLPSLFGLLWMSNSETPKFPCCLLMIYKMFIILDIWKCNFVIMIYVNGWNTHWLSCPPR